MASEANVYDRIERLVERGRVYYGQPTDSLRAVLASESAGWYSVVDGERYAWGERANEDIETMTVTAQQIVYGLPVSYEELASWPAHIRRRVEGLWQHVRGGGSPYYVHPPELAGFLIDCERENQTPAAVSIGGDSRNWCEEVHTWRELGPCADRAAKAIAWCWLGRYAHHQGRTLCFAYDDYASLAALKVAPHQLKPLLVAWLTLGDWGAATAVQRQHRSLKAIEDFARLAQALV